MLRHINDSHNHQEPDFTNIHPLTAKTQKHSKMRRLGDVFDVWFLNDLDVLIHNPTPI